MELIVISFILALFLVAMFGWTVDSRDGADWRASERFSPHA